MIVSLELQRNDEIGPEYDFVRLHVEREATSVAQKAFFLRNEDEGLKPTPCVGPRPGRRETEPGGKHYVSALVFTPSRH